MGRLSLHQSGCYGRWTEPGRTGTHALRPILRGTFDRLPGLTIILGHYGEGIPYMLPRIERNFPPYFTGVRREHWGPIRANFYFAFGGWNWPYMFEIVRRTVGVGPILFSTDYPYDPMEAGMRFLKLIEVSQDERELIAHGNAEALLRMWPRRWEC
ncbi:amidohydrolase family protein [Streptomyces sp. NPDC101150]|uniref:amidohydrolase family protein n=1 Tax=Streptomyces sp. NPDC101150 TaxID=3366114 RepID=UPI003810067D